MAEDKGILGNITENLVDNLKDKVDPSKLLSEKNLQKKRNAFWTCLIAAFLLVALALGAAVYYNATKVSLLTEGIQQHVDLAAVGLTEDSAKTFAVSTLGYLQGQTSEWAPLLVVGDHILPFRSFKAHMATVKAGLVYTAVLLAGGHCAGAAGPGFDRHQGLQKGSFSVGGTSRSLIPLVLIGGGSWGLSFESLWNLLHKALIPDGIFSATEPSCSCSQGLFAGYAKPVALTFAVLAAVLALPLILFPCPRC